MSPDTASPVSRSFHSWNGLTLAALLGGIVLGVAACDQENRDREAMEMVQYLPLAVVVPKGQEMQRAEAYAANHPGDVALWGVASRPLAHFGDHAGLVVKQVNFDDLRRGMTVIYLTDAGVRAGGLLVRRVDDGWEVKDWGAESESRQRVTARSLVGVVALAFVPPEVTPDPDAWPAPGEKDAKSP